MVNFSSRQKFSAWPNPDLPPVAAGVYAVWEGDTLIYCGMSGREFEKAVSAAKPKFGLGCVPKVVEKWPAHLIEPHPYKNTAFIHFKIT
ncbi:hypothetical protein D3C80_1993810 [compost metagenome]